MQQDGNENRPEQSRAQAYHSDPPMGEMGERINTRANRTTIDSEDTFLDNHIRHLRNLLDQTEGSNRVMGDTLNRLRGPAPSPTLDDAKKAHEPDAVFGTMQALTDRLQDAANHHNSMVEELRSLL
jgi:hypothetical protein